MNGKIEVSDAENNSVQETKKVQDINNTKIKQLNINNTDVSQLKEKEELEKIKEKCEFEIFEEIDDFGNVNKRKRIMVENAIEMMYYSQSLKVDNATIPQELVRNKLLEINGAIIYYALEKLETGLINTKNVTNSTKYLMSCIYSAITEYYSDAEIQYKIDSLK